MSFPRMMFVFCGNCYSRSYLVFKLFIPYMYYVILEKLRFQCFLYIPYYKETKFSEVRTKTPERNFIGDISTSLVVFKHRQNILQKIGLI